MPFLTSSLRLWWAYFYIEGVRHQQSTGTGNRRQAEQIAQKLREEANANQFAVHPIDPTLTFGALAARFIANAGPSAYHLDRLKFLLPYFTDTPVARLTKADTREYRATRHARNTRTSLKDATINRDLSVFRHILNWGVDEGLLTTNPLGRLRLVPERPTARTIVTVAEEERLLAAAPSHLAALVVMAVDTGMRRGELFHQRWEHVDFTRRVLQVSHSKTIQGEKREIPLTTRVEQLLNVCRPLTGLIFEYRGHALHTIKTTWRTTLKKAGVRHIRFHDLRHTFNTRLLEAGVLQEVRKALMGHVSGGGINAHYTHIELPLKREAIAKLERWLTQQQHQQTNKEDTHEPATRSGSTENVGEQAPRAKALEEEDPSRSGL
jgi:integrase